MEIKRIVSYLRPGRINYNTILNYYIPNFEKKMEKLSHSQFICYSQGNNNSSSINNLDIFITITFRFSYKWLHHYYFIYSWNYSDPFSRSNKGYVLLSPLELFVNTDISQKITRLI